MLGLPPDGIVGVLQTRLRRAVTAGRASNAAYQRRQLGHERPVDRDAVEDDVMERQVEAVFLLGRSLTDPGRATEARDRAEIGALGILGGQAQRLGFALVRRKMARCRSAASGMSTRCTTCWVTSPSTSTKRVRQISCRRTISVSALQARR